MFAFFEEGVVCADRVVKADTIPKAKTSESGIINFTLQIMTRNEKKKDVLQQLDLQLIRFST